MLWCFGWFLVADSNVDRFAFVWGYRTEPVFGLCENANPLRLNNLRFSESILSRVLNERALGEVVHLVVADEHKVDDRAEVLAVKTAN